MTYICLSWSSIVSGYILADGVKVVDCYNDNFLLCCLGKSDINHVYIQYNRTIVESVCQTDDGIKIKLRDGYKFYGKNPKIVKHFIIKNAYFEAEIC